MYKHIDIDSKLENFEVSKEDGFLVWYESKLISVRQGLYQMLKLVRTFKEEDYTISDENFEESLEYYNNATVQDLLIDLDGHIAEVTALDIEADAPYSTKEDIARIKYYWPALDSIDSDIAYINLQLDNIDAYRRMEDAIFSMFNLDSITVIEHLYGNDLTVEQLIERFNAITVEEYAEHYDVPEYIAGELLSRRPYTSEDHVSNIGINQFRFQQQELMANMMEDAEEYK